MINLYQSGGLVALSTCALLLSQFLAQPSLGATPERGSSQTSRPELTLWAQNTATRIYKGRGVLRWDNPGDGFTATLTKVTLTTSTEAEAELTFYAASGRQLILRGSVIPVAQNGGLRIAVTGAKTEQAGQTMAEGEIVVGPTGKVVVTTPLAIGLDNRGFDLFFKPVVPVVRKPLPSK